VLSQIRQQYVFKDDFYTLSPGHFTGKLWPLNEVHSRIFLPHLSHAEDISGQMESTDVGGLLLNSNKRFSWTCIQTSGEEAAQLITANQSVSIISRI
jgi:hypothetical protein